MEESAKKQNVQVNLANMLSPKDNNDTDLGSFDKMLQQQEADMSALGLLNDKMVDFDEGF